MKNLQTLHISNPLSSLSWLSLLSFFSKSFFLFPALILLFVVPHHKMSVVRTNLKLALSSSGYTELEWWFDVWFEEGSIP
jgi:hypothetical protein